MYACEHDVGKFQYDFSCHCGASRSAVETETVRFVPDDVVMRRGGPSRPILYRDFAVAVVNGARIRRDASVTWWREC